MTPLTLVSTLVTYIAGAGVSTGQGHHAADHARAHAIEPAGPKQWEVTTSYPWYRCFLMIKRSRKLTNGFVVDDNFQHKAITASITQTASRRVLPR